MLRACSHPRPLSGRQAAANFIGYGMRHRFFVAKRGFHLDDVEVPAFWSQVASDVLAQKYFRKAGVAARLKKVEEETVPSFLWRSVPDTEALAASNVPV